MANKKITELNALTDPDANDLLAIVDDPSGSPVTKRITATKLVKSLNNQAATLVLAASNSLHKERADYVCDGVDDQVEIQAAIDEIGSGDYGHGTIVFLDGEFWIEETINVNKYISFRGMSMNRTKLRIPASANETSLDIFDVSAATGTLYIITFEHLKMDGQLASAIPPAVHNGIVVRACSEIILSDSEVRSVNCAVHLNPSGSECIYNYIRNCYILQCDSGLVVIDNGGTALGELMISNTFFSNGDIELKADCEATDILINANRFWNASINIAGGSKIGIHNNIWKTTGNAKIIDFQDRSSPTDVEALITGNQIESSNTPQYSVYIGDNVDYINVLDNVVRGSVTPIYTAAGSNSHGVVESNPGYNPVGISAITPDGSPYTHTAGASPETVYISGGTVSAITKDGNDFGLTSGAFELQPHKTIIVTYSVAPTMFKDVH